MQNVATLTFEQAESGEQCLVILRAAPGVLGLALSRREDGDVEVFLGPEELRELVSALRRAEDVCTGKADSSAV